MPRFPRRLTGLVVAVVLLLGPLFVASSAAPAGATTGGPAVGAQYQGLWSDWTDAQRTVVLDKLAASGVRWVRIDVGWASVEERGPGQLNTWYLDRLTWSVDAARARGIQVLATLWTTPGWANGGQAREVAPSDPGQYARIAQVLAHRYQGRIAAWEVWNEPNDKDFFVGSVAQYTDLLRAAYPAFKAGDPGTSVVLGGPSLNDTPWLGQVYALGARGSFDIMATHPYLQPGDAPPETPDTSIATMTHVAAVKALMVANGDGHLPIWFTEVGWSTHANTSSTPAWARGVTAQQQADYVVRTLRMIASTYPYVTNVFWYMARDRRTGDVHQDGFGLMTWDLQDKPVLGALRDHLGGAVTASSGGGTSPTAALGAPAPSGAGGGYRMATAQGHVRAAGLPALGELGYRLNRPIVGMTSTTSGNGYWLVASDGGIFAFGDAGFFGSTGDLKLNKPIVGMAATPSGGGYWLVASDGGIFSFGDAGFHGSTGAIRLNQPIIGMSSTPSAGGYWLLAADGGLFTFGDAPFLGSGVERGMPGGAVGIRTTSSGQGYWIGSGNGTVHAYGDAPAYGNLALPAGNPATAMG